MKRHILSDIAWKKLLEQGAPVDEHAIIAKRFDCEVKAVDGDDDRVLEFTISTGAVDRQGDTIAVDGWQVDNFLKSGAVLWAHKSDLPPVARPLAVWVEGDKLKARAQFTPKDINEFGYNVYRMYREGYLKATSVGFRPIEHSINEERGGFFPTDFKRQELLEFSAVPVPANPEALVEAKAAGIDVDAVMAHFGATQSENKTVISYNQAHPDGTPKAGKDSDWDGPGQIAEASVDDLNVMCAWVDGENSESKSAYKLPHHKAGGSHDLVWRGVTAAMGALLGARGGVDIPEDEREGVYKHLAKHYAEFDEEPPELKAIDPGCQNDTEPEPTPRHELIVDMKLSEEGEATLKRIEALADKLHKCLFEVPLSEPDIDDIKTAPATPVKPEISKEEIKAEVKKFFSEQYKIPVLGIVD